MRVLFKALLITATIILFGLPTPAVTEEKEELLSPDEFVKLSFMPEMIYQETPVYPSEAIKAKTEGVVWVQALIMPDGSVADVKLLKSSEIESLDQSALEAAQKCKYKPGLDENKKPTASWVSYRVDFVLESSKVKEDTLGR